MVVPLYPLKCVKKNIFPLQGTWPNREIGFGERRKFGKVSSGNPKTIS